MYITWPSRRNKSNRFWNTNYGGWITRKVYKIRLPVLDVIKEGAYFIDGNHTYHIEYTDNPFFYRDEIFDHIVNSFKFIPIVEDVNSGISNNDEESNNDDEESNNDDEESNNDDEESN